MRLLPFVAVAIAFLAVLSLTSCGGMSAQDVGAVKDARNLCQYAYQHAGDAGISSADNRACFCALDGVLARNGAGDDAGVIRCR